MFVKGCALHGRRTIIYITLKTQTMKTLLFIALLLAIIGLAISLFYFFNLVFSKNKSNKSKALLSRTKLERISAG